jgi:hypothetical protein
MYTTTTTTGLSTTATGGYTTGGFVDYGATNHTHPQPVWSDHTIPTVPASPMRPCTQPGCRGVQTLTPMVDISGKSTGFWWRCSHCLYDGPDADSIDDGLEALRQKVKNFVLP